MQFILPGYEWKRFCRKCRLIPVGTDIFQGYFPCLDLQPAINTQVRITGFLQIDRFKGGLDQI
jgi:hypothetical protein